MELEPIDQTTEDVKAEKKQSQSEAHFQGLEELGWEEFAKELNDIELVQVITFEERNACRHHH